MRLSPHRAESARIVVCVPWSGAGPAWFGQWAAAMPAEVELLAAVLPGRDVRRTEPLHGLRLDVLAAEITAALRAYAGSRRISIFGHSLGALLGYQVAVNLQELGSGVDALVASGSRGPAVPPIVELHKLDDTVLLQRLHELGGLRDGKVGEAWRARILERTRSDLRACELFRRRDAPLLHCPVTTWAGADDWYAPETEVRQWDSVSTRPVRHRTFAGDHFFVKSLAADVLLDDLGWPTPARRAAA